MNDLCLEFNVFHQHINLTSLHKKSINNFRSSLHNRISQHFKHELNYRPPVFLRRGRQAMCTMIAPKYGELLIEEAVLLQHLARDTPKEWPKPDILHILILNAIQSHTPDPPMDRKYSVCAHYAGLYSVRP